MKQLTSYPRTQLALLLEAEPKLPLEQDIREALIATLADLLLEAYGEEEDIKRNGYGGHNER